MNELRLNVHDLISLPEYRLSDEWKVLGGMGVGRAHLGSKLHSDYLNDQKSDTYKKEVWLVHNFTWKNYSIILQGRLDGMYETAEGWIVEEIKSTHYSYDQMKGLDVDISHEEQCKFYCQLLHMSGTDVCGGVVVYISLFDGKLSRYDLEFDPDQMFKLLDERLEKITTKIEEEKRIALLRAEAVNNFHFPFEKMRPSQDIMINDIKSAANSGMRMLCSAPTGTGKTVAALYPMTEEALRRNGKLFFVTNRISQQELALETMRKLIPEGGYALALQIRAKERSCPMEEMRCIQGACPYLNNFAIKLEENNILNNLAGMGTVDADRLTEIAIENKVCPFETTLSLALRATVIIADFNYVFDPGAYLRRFFDKPDENLLLIVDEAHNLTERARSFYSPELDINKIKRMQKTLQELSKEPMLGFVSRIFPESNIFERAEELFSDFCNEFNRSIQRFMEEFGESKYYVEYISRDFVEDIAGRLETLIIDYRLYQSTVRKRPDKLAPVAIPSRRQLQDPLLEILYNINDFCRCRLFELDLFATVWYPDGFLKMICLDAGPLLKNRFDIFHSVLCMSATLTPFEFFSKTLGLDGRETLNLELTSPFSPERRLFLAVDSVKTTFKHRSENAEEIARIIISGVQQKKGNYLVFFSSFAFRDEVIAKMNPGDYRLIIQTPAMPARLALDILEKNKNETVLLCAVFGGVFSEGVDFPDHLAIGAFVVGPSLPMLSVEQELRREYFANQGVDGFEYAYIFPGMNRIIQAGGRVIRKETDSGFVVMIGERFLEEKYFKKLPSFWRDELVVSKEPEHILNDFWYGFQEDK